MVGQAARARSGTNGAAAKSLIDVKDQPQSPYRGFSTRAIRVGQDPDATTGSSIVPIYQTATYTQQAPGSHRGYDYSRTANPTRTALEKQLASLESAAFATAFASGMAAGAGVASLLARRPRRRDARYLRRLLPVAEHRAARYGITTTTST